MRVLEDSRIFFPWSLMCIVECWEIIAAVGVSVGFLEFLVCLQCWELDCIL